MAGPDNAGDQPAAQAVAGGGGGECHVGVAVGDRLQEEGLRLQGDEVALLLGLLLVRSYDPLGG